MAVVALDADGAGASRTEIECLLERFAHPGPGVCAVSAGRNGNAIHYDQ